MTDLTRRASELFNSKGVRFVPVRLVTAGEAFRPEPRRPWLVVGLWVRTEDGTEVLCLNNGCHYEEEVVFPDGTRFRQDDLPPGEVDEYVASFRIDTGTFYHVLTEYTAEFLRERDWDRVK